MEDGEDEGGLHLPVTIFLEDVSNHPQEGPRWLLLKKIPHMDIWKQHRRSKTTSQISFGASIHQQLAKSISISEESARKCGTHICYGYKTKTDKRLKNSKCA